MRALSRRLLVVVALFVAGAAVMRLAAPREDGRPVARETSSGGAEGPTRPGMAPARGLLPSTLADDGDAGTAAVGPLSTPPLGSASTSFPDEMAAPSPSESAHGTGDDEVAVDELPSDMAYYPDESAGDEPASREQKIPARGTGRIFGTVLGKDGLPIQLVLISVRREEDGGRLDRKPNAKGQYEAVSLAGGTYVVTCVVQGEAVLSRRLGLAEGEEKRVDFSVKSGVRLFGWVSRGGRAVAEVQLSFAPEHGADVTATFASTDAQGNYEVRGVPPGAVLGRVGKHDHRIWIPEGVDELRFDIALPEGVIAGHVYGGRERAPAKGARVDVYRVGDPKGDLAQHASRWVTGAEADVQGRYEAKGVAGGRYVLHVSHPEHGLRVHGPVDVPDRGAAEGIDLYLGDPGHLLVSVMTSSAVPLGDAVITMRDAISGEPIRPLQERSKPSRFGSFLLKGVPAGEYRVTAHARGYAQSTQRVAVADGLERVEFRLVEEALLRVRVKDTSGKPVEHAVLVLWDATGEPVDPTPGDWDDPSTSQTDETGGILRGGLGSGSYSGEVASGPGRARFTFEASEGKITEVEVTVQPVPEEER